MQVSAALTHGTRSLLCRLVLTTFYSTCHVIFPVDIFDALPEASEDEEDMLDMAFGLTETSRLGCQIIVTEAMEGMLLEMPKATRNFYVDGHVPKPH
jgi:hypothetical protein